MSSRSEPRELVDRDLARMNIGRRYWEADLLRVPDDAQHKELVARYCRRVHGVRKRGMGLLLWGDNSRGKTYSAAVILKNAVRHGYSAYMVVADQLKAAIIERHVFEDTDLGPVSVEERVRTVDFLCIDDIGKEYSGQSGFAEVQFENLMRHRTRNLLPTVVTTNLTLEAYRDRYAKSAFEIAKECLFPFQVKGTGDSFRAGLARDLRRKLEGT